MNRARISQGHEQILLRDADGGWDPGDGETIFGRILGAAFVFFFLIYKFVNRV